MTQNYEGFIKDSVLVHAYCLLKSCVLDTTKHFAVCLTQFSNSSKMRLGDLKILFQLISTGQKVKRKHVMFFFLVSVENLALNFQAGS